MGEILGYGEITVANMTEPFTVMLTNEAQQFATDSNRKVTFAQSYYTDIIIIRGSQQRTDYTIGNITSANGISVSKSATRVTFSVSAGSTISADAGTIMIPITLDGQTVNKTFSWSCGKQGIQGVKGQNAKSITITPSSQIFKSTDGGNTFAPNTITITPTIQGEISFGKWQYSIDGGVSFTDVVSGQKGLSISNNVLSVSKNSSLYTNAVTMVIFRAIASDSAFYDTCSIAKLYDVTELEIGGVNLFVKATVTKGYWLSNIGNQNADNIWGYSDYIDVSMMKNYIASGFTNLGIAPATCFYDSNKAFVSGVQSENQNSQNSKRRTLPIPSNAKYMRFSFALADIDTLKIEQGTKATAYSQSPQDVQTAILSTKSELSSVSSKVDQNAKAITNKVENTTYQNDLKLVKGDISKANDGLNKWRYEIYPKNLFASDDQSKSELSVFARNKNLIPSQTVLIDDVNLGIDWNYGENYIGYAVTFVKMSDAKSVSVTFAHDDGAHVYLNGKLIGGSDANTNNSTGESLTLGFIKGWNCIEVVVNEQTSGEGFKFGTTISAISECQLMNCYYAMITGRESQITNTLVQTVTDLNGVNTKVGKVTSVIGENGENYTEFKNDYSDFKQTMNGFKTTVGQTYVTKDDFNGLEIGGVNLFVKSTASRGWWISNTGVLNADGGWGYSDYIDVSGMKNYIASGFTNLGISPATCFYDSNKTFISGVASKNQNSQDSKRKTLPIPSNAKYMRFSFALADIDTLKIEQGTKATAYSPAPEDDEINGQNLVSNLPSNWEQGTVTEGSTTGTTYANTKSSSAGSVRPKELIPVSGNITISTAYSNQSKKPIRHWIAAYDINKNYLGNNYVSNAWNSFPRTLNMKDAKYIAIMVGYTDSSAITPSDISQICLKIERGTSATPFTLAPEDVNGKIVNVETIANQTAKKFEWIVKGGDSSSNFTLTDRVADLVAERINFNGLVTFSGLAKSTQDKINSPTSGNLITVSPTNPTSNYGNTTFSIVSDDVGGRCIQTTAQFVPFTNYASNIFKPGEQIYYNINVPNWSSTTFDANLGIWFFTAEKKCVANSCTRVTLQRTTWNQLSGYITVPTSGWSGIIYYVIGIENPNKYQLGLVSNSYIEKTTSYATTYASSAVNWVTNNGSSTTSLNSMVKKWTDGAVSDTTQINGGWIKANTITASKIAVGDFTNYADINESNTYGFSVEKTTDGVWFSKDGSKLIRDNYISKMYSCEPGQTFYVEYDISNTIKDSTEYKAAGIMLFGCDGTQTVKWCQRRGAVVGTAAGTVTHMSQQLTMPSGTRFFYVVLQIEGFQPFTGTLKIRNLSVRKAVTGAVIVDGSITADKIATDAIKSRNYISSGGTQGSFLNLSDGSFTSPNLSWDSNGNLIAKNANLSGEITATKGTIGKYEITDQWLTTGSGSTCTGIGGNQAFWAGAEHSNSAPFRVGYDGKLTSSNADITGTITATNGKIGRYDITSTYLMTNSGSNASGIGGNQAFWAGAEDSNSAPFRVGYDGVLWAENAAIRGSIETGNLGDEGDTVFIINGHIGIRGTSNNVEIYSTGFKFGIDGDYYLESVSEGVKCYRNLYATDFIADGWIYNASGGHYTWKDRNDAYISCGDYNGHNVYYYANYHAFYVNKDSGQGMMYINTNGVTSRVGFTKTSDERIKKNFESFDDNIIDAYMNIEPVKYQLKQSSNDKYHFGFKAQHIDKVFSDYGDIYNESFDICTSRPIDPNKAKELYGVDGMVEEYGLRYDELIAPTTYMVQHTYKELESTKDELTKIKQEKTDLETRLQAIEAKLGL